MHRTRELLVRQRTMVVNAMCVHMALFGIVAPAGVPQVKKLLAIIDHPNDDSCRRSGAAAWRLCPMEQIRNQFSGIPESTKTSMT